MVLSTKVLSILFETLKHENNRSNTSHNNNNIKRTNKIKKNTVIYNFHTFNYVCVVLVSLLKRDQHTYNTQHMNNMFPTTD